MEVSRYVPCPHDHVDSSEEESQSRALNMAPKAKVVSHSQVTSEVLGRQTKCCWGIGAKGARSGTVA